ncbi:hypothetical protein N6H14_23965 [Paenibacillus sp. CC-CFT747]|nr:hypothetical protein N6H14_23965 [Paenibacillus sp. CC-CFT747]
MFQQQTGSNQGRSSKMNAFQPTGYVQSSYKQNQQAQSGTRGQSYGMSQGAQSFHTSSYKGNQQGHDTYLRADSQKPAQSGYSSMGSQSFTSMSSKELPLAKTKAKERNPSMLRTTRETSKDMTLTWVIPRSRLNPVTARWEAKASRR